MSRKHIRDLKMLGFKVLKRSSVDNYFRNKFAHVKHVDEAKTPVYATAKIKRKFYTFVLDEKGRAWLATCGAIDLGNYPFFKIDK